MVILDALFYSFLAGCVTIVGAFSTYLFTWHQRTIAFAFGVSSGVMLFVAYFSMLPLAVRFGGMRVIFIGLLSTILFMYLLHRLPLGKVEKGKTCTTPHLERVGFFLVLAIIAHHLPEGTAIGAGFDMEHGLGFLLVTALAIHNLPEGMALAIPLIASGRSRYKVLALSLLCGMSLPIGTWIGMTWLSGSKEWMSISLAFAAVTMVWIMVREVFPQAWSLNRNWAISGLVLGGCFMYFLHHLHT